MKTTAQSHSFWSRTRAQGTTERLQLVHTAESCQCCVSNVLVLRLYFQLILLPLLKHAVYTGRAGLIRSFSVVCGGCWHVMTGGDRVCLHWCMFRVSMLHVTVSCPELQAGGCMEKGAVTYSNTCCCFCNSPNIATGRKAHTQSCASTNTQCFC